MAAQTSPAGNTTASKSSSTTEKKKELERPVWINNKEGSYASYMTSEITEALTPMVYTLKYEYDDIMFVKKTNNFTLPKQIFGKSKEYQRRIQTKYAQNDKSVGLLSIGLKGSGKSLLSESLGNWMIDKQKLPVLMVESPIPLESLRKVLKDVGPCMLYFDEFGKVYSYSERAELLPLFSDTSIKGVLFSVTANEESEVNEFLMDRPGRFLFRIMYKGVDKDGLEEIFEGLKLSDVLKDHLRNYVKIHVNVSYDVLLKLIDEIKDCTTEDEIRSLMEVLNVPSMPVMGYRIRKIVGPQGQNIAISYQQFDPKERKIKVHFFDDGRRQMTIIDVDQDVKENGDTSVLLEKDGYIFDTAKRRVIPAKDSISEEEEVQDNPNARMMAQLGFY